MRKTLWIVLALVLMAGWAVAADLPVAPNGIALYPEFMSWKPLAPSYREDKGHIRLITANDVALAGLRAGKNPLPDGSVLAKVAWKAVKHPAFPVATEPGEFVQVEFMVKDARKYAATGGWGFARFVGKELKPYGKDPGFVAECFGCHTPVAAKDYLFTSLPSVP